MRACAPRCRRLQLRHSHGGARPPGRRCGWRLPTSSVSEPQEQRWHRLHDHVVHGLRGAGHCTSPMRTTSTRPGPMCHVLATRASPVTYVARSRVRGWIERVEFRSGAVAGRPPGGSEGFFEFGSEWRPGTGPARVCRSGTGNRIRNTGRAKTAARRDPVSAGWPHGACIRVLVVVRAAFRFVTVPVKEANTPRWNVPLKNENYSTKLPSRQPLARQRSRYGSTADSNACLYDRPHRRHRLSIIRSPYRLPPRGSCHRSSA